MVFRNSPRSTTLGPRFRGGDNGGTVHVNAVSYSLTRPASLFPIPREQSPTVRLPIKRSWTGPEIGYLCVRADCIKGRSDIWGLRISQQFAPRFGAADSMR